MWKLKEQKSLNNMWTVVWK